MCVRSTRVTQEAARVVMNYIDFRAAVECLFRSDIIRTEKLYKIAVVLTIKIKKYLCTHCYCRPPPITAPPRASKCSKFGKVWLWSQLPHNTWSLVSQRTGGMKEGEKNERSTPSFTINPCHYDKFFFFPSLYVKKYSLWEFKITKTLFIIPFSQWKAQFKVFCVCCWGRLGSFVSFCALYAGFLSVQCGGLAWELHTVQIQPEELHGYQLRGLRPCGENSRTQTHTSTIQYFAMFLPLCLRRGIVWFWWRNLKVRIKATIQTLFHKWINKLFSEGIKGRQLCCPLRPVFLFSLFRHENRESLFNSFRHKNNQSMTIFDIMHL